MQLHDDGSNVKMISEAIVAAIRSYHEDPGKFMAETATAADPVTRFSRLIDMVLEAVEVETGNKCKPSWPIEMEEEFEERPEEFIQSKNKGGLRVAKVSNRMKQSFERWSICEN